MDFDCNVPRDRERFRYHVDNTKIKQYLKNLDWEGVYQQSSVENMAGLFVSQLTDCISRNTIKYKIRNNDAARKDWITPGLIKSIQVKNELYQELLKRPNDPATSIKYKDYKNILSKLIKTTKKGFYKSEIDKNKNSAKNLYRCVNSICGCSKTKANDITQIKQENGSITEDVETIANLFGKHYAEHGQELASKLTATRYGDSIKPIDETIFLGPTTEPEVMKTVESLKSNSSPGADGIRVSTLKEIKAEIVKPLSVIINKIMENGVWPTCFGEGIIKPLYKSGDPSEIINYRPITLISSVAKIAEKIIKTRIMHFLKKHSVISDKQYGFMEARSTEDAIACLTEYVYKGIDRNKPTVCMFVDLAKAFDTVSHKILLEKIEKYGFRGRAYSLVKSYLINQTQSVQMDRVRSDPRAVKIGVPQGTVLGPTLFLLYINDLLALNTVGKILSYADDTAVVYSGDTWDGLRRTVEDDMQNIVSWFNKNRLTLNHNKTTFLSFSSYPRETFSTLRIKCGQDTVEIHASETVKYLGIVIDKHLKWNAHINYTIKKLRGLLPKFKTLREYLSVEQLRVLYHSLVQSHISYGIIGWGGAYKNTIKNLEIQQKRFLKLILNKPMTYSSDVLYSDAHVFDLRQLFSYKVLNRQYLHKDHIRFVTHRHNTRQRDILCTTTRCHKTKGQQCHIFIGQKLYNVIPEGAKHSRTKHVYQKSIRDWLFEVPRHYIHNLIDT